MKNPQGNFSFHMAFTIVTMMMMNDTTLSMNEYYTYIKPVNFNLHFFLSYILIFGMILNYVFPFPKIESISREIQLNENGNKKPFLIPLFLSCKICHLFIQFDKEAKKKIE